MSGFSCRNKYDNCYTNDFINQQTNPGSYNIEPYYAENNNKHVYYFGPRQNSHLANTESFAGNLVERKDVENYLLNLDVPNSRCVNINTIDNKNKKLQEIMNKIKVDVKDDDNKMNDVYTRLNNNILDNRSVYINRYGFPIVEPSLTIFYGFENTKQVNNNRFGVNTRLMAKDSY